MLLVDLPDLVWPRSGLARLASRLPRRSKRDQPERARALPLLRQAGASEAMLAAWALSDDESVKTRHAPHLLRILTDSTTHQLMGARENRVTVDDAIAFYLTFPTAASTTEAYAWMRATRHGWAFTAAGVPVQRASEKDVEWTFEALSVLAGLSGRRMPPLTTGPLEAPTTTLA